jgi:hypothetical protein
MHGLYQRPSQPGLPIRRSELQVLWFAGNSERYGDTNTQGCGECSMRGVAGCMGTPRPQRGGDQGISQAKDQVFCWPGKAYGIRAPNKEETPLSDSEAIPFFINMGN